MYDLDIHHPHHLKPAITHAADFFGLIFKTTSGLMISWFLEQALPLGWRPPSSGTPSLLLNLPHNSGGLTLSTRIIVGLDKSKADTKIIRIKFFSKIRI